MDNYRLYIDESGDHSFSNLEDPGKRFLGLLGLIINTNYYIKKFQPNFEKMKQKYFPHHPDDPIILHRKDIISKRGCFWVLRNPDIEKSFNRELLKFLNENDFNIILIVLDKKLYFDYCNDDIKNPYHISLNKLIEKYCCFLNQSNSKGDVLAESRGGKEDRLLKNEFQNIYNFGTKNNETTFFSSTLLSNEIKIKNKNANIAGLQIADLLAYPCKMEAILEDGFKKPSENKFGYYIIECLKKKHNKKLKTETKDTYLKILTLK